MFVSDSTLDWRAEISNLSSRGLLFTLDGMLTTPGDSGVDGGEGESLIVRSAGSICVDVVLFFEDDDDLSDDFVEFVFVELLLVVFPFAATIFKKICEQESSGVY